MSITVCLGAYSLRFVQGGAYMWVFLNWALGLRSLGFRVIWLDSVVEGTPIQKVLAEVAELKCRLETFGLSDDIAIVYRTGEDLSAIVGCLALDEALKADLFLNLGYDLNTNFVKRFRRSAFVDIDPGLTQTWISLGQIKLATHDLYFTYGEHVSQYTSHISNCGLKWFYTPPPIFLPAWTIKFTDSNSFYTTISAWWDDNGWIEIDGTYIDNSKRSAFLEYINIPQKTSANFELAIPLSVRDDVTNDYDLLKQHGWSIKNALDVASTPIDFQLYVQSSRGEFSCMKRGYINLETAWTSERTLNYLASGKPAIVQYTGPSYFLPDADGLFRFRNMDEAINLVVYNILCKF